ncbi:hypothetical protein ABIC86_002512 [Paenibacillus sp. DS2363]
MVKYIIGLIIAAAVAFGVYNVEPRTEVTQIEQKAPDYTITFPSERYPETALHIKEAVAAGHSDTCTIDRDGADNNRDLSLRGVDTKKGYDRDEWPMAMCAEGGEGAHIKHISPKDNRGAGSWVGHQLSDYPDGARIQFVIE